MKPLHRLAVALAWVGVASAQEPAPAAVVDPPDLVIAHFNDFHGQVLPRRVVPRPGLPAEDRGGFAAMEAEIRALRAAHPDRVWVTNGGDWFQGTPEGTEDRGLSVVLALERLAPVATVIGNHEYDFGERALSELIGSFRHPVLGANVCEAGTPRLRPYVRPYIVKLVPPSTGQGEPQRVAIVGLVTADTPKVSTGPFGSAEFADEAATLDQLWPALRRDADRVVLLSHCGVKRDRELAQRFPELALILGGHSHTELRRPVTEGKTVIVQSGCNAVALTELELRVRSGVFDVLAFRFVDLPAPTAVDSDTQTFLDHQFAHISEHWDTPLGVVRGAADRRESAGSTPAGSFIAALIREAGHADVGLTNKGGLRTTLAAGPITRRDVFALVPFENSVVTFELTGAQLRGLLAQSLEGGRRPLEIDGASYGYTVAGGARTLTEVKIAGTDLVPERAYRVATNSFLAGGGDGIDGFAVGREVERGEAFLRDLVVRHLETHGAIDLPGDSRIEFAPR